MVVMAELAQPAIINIIGINSCIFSYQLIFLLSWTLVSANNMAFNVHHQVCADLTMNVMKPDRL